eukprot:CAMPEP_0197028040 /NCGR_PEP_ID=MMETSP1384-20130603/7845_1 /TAXON_ID=29189 /ORGANISM="Ammonia sp." /LENGTH=517 /DNA_ID=CAMNT_0042456981 /DNA_START=27 /DNA_END=1580 /DNA_ORIENTATION=+
MDSILKDSYKPAESLSMVDLLQADMDNQLQAQHLSQTCGKNLNRCTYSKGYIDQPVFACLTCSNVDSNHNSNTIDADKQDYTRLSGFCLGCSMNCHLDHNVIELWNKRHFKCDCGNTKFANSAQTECLLSCQKDDINAANEYNHNFLGKYCYCNREYSVAHHTMHQCLNCQDWFHQTCIILHHLKLNPNLQSLYQAQQSTQHQAEEHEEEAKDDKHEDAESADHDQESPFFEYFRKLLIPQSEDEENCFDAFICKDCAAKYQHFFVPYRWRGDHEKHVQALPDSVNCNDKNTTSSSSTTAARSNKRTFSEMQSNDDDTDEVTKAPQAKRRKLNHDQHAKQMESNNDNKELHQDENKEVDEQLAVCTRLRLSEEDKQDIAAVIGGGLWFEAAWIEKLCACKECTQEIYEKYRLDWLFEAGQDSAESHDNGAEDGDDDDDSNPYDVSHKVDESQPLAAEFSTDAMIANSIRRMPRKQTIDALSVMMKGTDMIKQKLVDYIRLNPNKVIDANDIRNIFNS